MAHIDWETGCNRDSVIALGFFDGVHLGHQKVISAAAEEAHRMNMLCGAFTFTDKNSLLSKCGNKIYSDERRRTILLSVGADYVIMPDFSQIKELSPTEFVSALEKKFHAKALCCGKDFKFGKGGEGNIGVLKELCRQKNIKLIEVDEVFLQGESVRSTRIRSAIADGDMPLCSLLLGRDYSIKCEVVGGKHIGTQMLYPTVNQNLEPDNVLMKLGVYASLLCVDGKEYKAVTDVGICPTVSDGERIASETHVIGKSLDLYGKEAEVKLKRFIRDEKKFGSIAELKEQIAKDIKTAEKILGK